MKTRRKRYGADFKAQVALEAIRGDLTLAELAAKHGAGSHFSSIAADLGFCDRPVPCRERLLA